MKIHVAVLAAALVAGCATHQQGRAWYTLSEQSFAGIKPGTTSKADVQRDLGDPALAMTFARQGEEVWDYRFLNGTRYYVAELHFDTQGVAKYVAMYPDRCALRAMPCR